MVQNYQLDEIIALMERRKGRKKTEGQYFDLQKSERALVSAAAGIYAAYIAAGKVEEGKEEDFIARSVDGALSIALKIEKIVDDAEEKTQG